jgi:hypothetical protein
MCLTCVGHDPRTVEIAFLAAVEDAGARLAPGEQYRGVGSYVELICVNGHRRATRPNYVQSGGPVCGACTRKFDRVYLLKHHEAQAIKVGITGGLARVRHHLRFGYELVVEVGVGDAGGAESIEREIIRWWRWQGYLPVDDAPLDGRTETADLSHLNETALRLQLLAETANGGAPVLVRPSVAAPSQLNACDR